MIISMMIWIRPPTDEPYKDYPWKMPKSLYKQLLQSGKQGEKGRTVIFFTNPPFKGTGNARKHNSKIESNIIDGSTNLVHPLMKHLGQASEQLYCQFFFRTLKIIKDFNIKNAYIAFFSLPRFLTGGRGWKKFNRFFFSRVKLIKGFLMKNREFNDTSSLWPILFGIYKVKDKKLTNLNALDNLNFNLPIYIRKLNPSSEQSTIIDSGLRHHYQLVYTKNSFANWVQDIGIIPSSAKKSVKWSFIQIMLSLSNTSG